MQNNLKVLGGAAIALGLAAFLFLALPLAAKPPVAWEPSAIDLGVPPGEELRTEVVVHVSERVEGAVLEVTPSLAPYIVAIAPAALSAASGDSEVVIGLHFAVPDQEAFGEIEGTLQVREDRARPGNGRGRTNAKPLPITLVIGDLLYPPDPGERGDETLEGVDSDADGVRDDIQRYIAVNFPEDANIRASLSQFATSYQEALTSTQSGQDALSRAQEIIKAENCLYFLAGPDSDVNAVFQVHASLLAELLNTSERSAAYINYSRLLSGNSFPLGDFSSPAACDGIVNVEVN